MIFIMGIIDYLTGFEIAFSFYYMFPISLATWTLGSGAGSLLSSLSALIWLSVNLLAGEQFSNVFISYWNALTRAGFFYFVVFLLTELQQSIEYQKKLALTDSLTELNNPRAFHKILALEVARMDRHSNPLTLLFFDLDNFKAVNDIYGHHIGDILLQAIAKIITQNIRAIDTAARLGGDEFALLLPATNLVMAKSIAPRIRQNILIEMEKNEWPVTLSMGVVTCHQVKTPEEMIRLADQLMYLVKNTTKDGIQYSMV
jgi:diguanylate cyclase (GGDEF)-like protein